MKQKAILLSIILLNMFCLGNVVYASFPVKTTKSIEVKEEAAINRSTNETENGEAVSILPQGNSVEYVETMTSPAASPLADDEMLITLLLWLVLGLLAAHRWYVGKPTGWNILFILTGGGLGVWAIVDLINILTGSFFE